MLSLRGRELISVLGLLVFAVGELVLYSRVNPVRLNETLNHEAGLLANFVDVIECVYVVQWLWVMGPSHRQQVAAQISTRSLSVSLILPKRY
jgi:hypothetical protein